MQICGQAPRHAYLWCGVPKPLIPTMQEFLLILKEVPASLDAPDAPAVMAEAKASLLFSLHSKRATAGAALNQVHRD